MLVSFCAAILAVPFAAQQTQRRTPDIYFAPTPHVLADAMLTLAKVTHDDVVYPGHPDLSEVPRQPG